MKFRMTRYLLALLSCLAVLLTASCGGGEKGTDKPAPSKPSKPVVKRTFPKVDSLVGTAKVVLDVAASTTTTLAPGVVWTSMNVTIAPSVLDAKPRNHPEKLNIVAVDPYSDGIYLRVATPGLSVAVPSGAWPQATLTEMAGSLEAEGDVIAMTNASFWNTSTFVPRGPVHSNGTVIWDKFTPLSSGKQGVSYFGSTKGGSVAIAASDQYATMGSIYNNLTGTGLLLVKDGAFVNNDTGTEEDRHPRTAVGYTSDNYVFFLCVDGREINEGVSEGMTMDDMGSIFLALGCKAAVNMDGGGSTQMLVRDPATGKRFICNNPSDGSERPLVDCWAVMKKK